MFLQPVSVDEDSRSIVEHRSPFLVVHLFSLTHGVGPRQALPQTPYPIDAAVGGVLHQCLLSIDRKLEELLLRMNGDADVNHSATSSSEVEAPLPELMSAANMAQKLGQPVDRIDIFLRRYREDYPDCYIVMDHPRRGEPKYLYRTADVWPPLQERLPTWRRQGE